LLSPWSSLKGQNKTQINLIQGDAQGFAFPSMDHTIEKEGLGANGIGLSGG
jgi:hypothetical protein